MIIIKIYRERSYYLSKYGSKEYLNGSRDDSNLIAAALLTGNGLNREEELVYTAYGETREDAEKSMASYLKMNPVDDLTILRTEVRDTEGIYETYPRTDTGKA